MKHLAIQNREYNRLQQSFREWLQLLNFEPGTIYYSPIQLTEFLNWLESNELKTIGQITRKTVSAYINYLRSRQHQRKGGKLSKNYLRTHLQTLRKFARYLRETSQDSFEVITQIKGPTRHVKTVLTSEEMTTSVPGNRTRIIRNERPGSTGRLLRLWVEEK